MNSNNKEYTYYCRLRLPTPGTQPKKGLLRVNSDGVTMNNREYWGTVTYNRELTESELFNYDLDKFD